ncbi:MAG: carbon starvation protein A [Planctomycetota bacterium]|nr:carbon starvation protein A [Planctomycetota bacterium]
MNAALLAAIVFASFALGYRYYSRFLSEQIFALREDEAVPSVELEDGVDFVPTRKSILWGHHYTSIAGAAPIVGPAIAVIWGWLPALLWVTLGTIFMGAVHDFAALVISLRHRGHSIGEVAATVVSPRVRTMFLVVVSFLIWIVLAVFAFIIGTLFHDNPAAILPINVQIVLALALGWLVYRRGVPILVPTLVVYGVLLLTIFYGQDFADAFPAVGELSVLSWVWILLLYSFVASVLPVWLLLQPRDYLNSHQLLTGLFLLSGGLLVLQPTIVAPVIDASPEGAPPMIPFLFITIACGAISGFHGLVGSGTTSKQICRATDARPIGYGAMLCEAALAILATLAVATGLWNGPEHVHAFEYLSAVTAAGEADGALHLPQVPQALAAFVNGAAGFLGALGLPITVAAAVVAVLVISFAATSLDTALRIQRLILAELGATYRISGLSNRWIGGALACGSVLLLIWADFEQGAKSLWPVFGATNQVLAAFTLLLCALYLRTLGRRATAYAAPAVIVMVITISAMGVQVWRDFSQQKWGVAGVGAMIGLLTLWVALEGALAWRRGPSAPAD